ncbi:MAG: DUF1616 domain-containing protein [Dehalococcoidales bacterium]
MKIKLLNRLIIIDILVIFLVLCIFFFPSSIVRIILGLPFLLYFPGYMIVEALFIRKEGMDSIERVGISFGMSLAVVALIGLGLNYTPWGIRLEPILYSISALIILISVVALIRQSRLHNLKLTQEFTLKLPGWEGNTFSKFLNIVLVFVILGSLGVLGYVVAVPKAGEFFTEFYLLGPGGKAEDFTDQLILGESGNVTVGLINHENMQTSYLVKVFITGQESNKMGPILLADGEKWEGEMTFTPTVPGDNQKVEFQLFKGDDMVTPANSLHLWINVK